MIITTQDGKLYDVASNSTICKVRSSVMLCDEVDVTEVGHYKSEEAARFVTESANASRVRQEDYKMPSAEEAEVEWRATREEERAKAKERLRRTREIVWIPVEERLPDNWRLVLVTAKLSDLYSVLEARYYGEHCWKWTDDEAFPDLVDVIAWAETPEPYKRKDEREEGEE